MSHSIQASQSVRHQEVQDRRTDRHQVSESCPVAQTSHQDTCTHTHTNSTQSLQCTPCNAQPLPPAANNLSAYTTNLPQPRTQTLEPRMHP